ncbi:MAG TPA: hypothetical protein P5531_07025 [Bacteroidales bacterium]|nr:hypothetical protein [Bacteroidales bacterium]HSA43364.1 hypothetical protein [Bacteroidales bacterium]
MSHPQNGRWPLFSLGLISISVQVVFLRKFLDVFYGNEMIIGLLLANWMLLTGAGAVLSKLCGGKIPLKLNLSGAFMLLGILPVLTVVMIVAGKIWFFPSGSANSLLSIFLFTLLVQAPFCLVSGWLFPVLAEKAGFRPVDALSLSYLTESLGSFAGALVFNTVLVFFLPVQWILFLLLLFSLVQAILLKQNRKAATLLPYTLPAVLVLILLPLINPMKMLSTWYYGGQEVLYEKESPYGNLVLTLSAGQKNLYENGLPVFSSDDPISREESVHFAMLQHADPKRVLLIAGGISGQAGEILKYDIEFIDYLELNPWIIQTGLAHGMIPSDPGLRPLAADARAFLKKNREEYDVVLIQLSDPVTAQLNRYFTFDFFRELQQHVKPGGIVSLSLRSTADYINPTSLKINSLIYNSLLYNFKYVKILAGNRNYFLASNVKPRRDIGRLSEERGISAEYVNPFYLEDDLLEKRSEGIEKRMDKGAGLNRDLHPRAYLLETRLWMFAFPSKWWIPAIITAGLLAWFFVRARRAQIQLFVTGFTASSAGFLLMMAFQALYGYIYLMSGVMISIFMLGLALGCLLHTFLLKRETVPGPAWIQVFIGAYIILVLMFLLGYKSITGSGEMLAAMFLLLSMMSGFFTGFQFAALASDTEGEIRPVAAGIYSAELAGSALGMLLTASLLLPLGGPVWLCLGLAVMNFVTGFVGFD